MAEKVRMRFRSRTVFVCTGKTGVESNAEDAFISVDTLDGPVDVTIAAGELLDDGRSQMQVTATIEKDVSGKPAAVLLEYWSYWNATSKDTGTKKPPPALTPEVSHLFMSTGAVKRDTAHEVVATYRWRWQLDVPSIALRHVRSEFAYDDKDWVVLGPASGKITAGRPFLTAAGPLHASEVDRLLGSGEAEPIAHELLEEAFSLKTTAPRSALILSCTALEVGTKQLIASLAPDTAWLLKEMASPPVEKLLRDYLPQLPRRAFARDASERFSIEFMRQIKKVVTLRNELVHRGTATIRSEWLDEWLKQCKDLLYLFDLYNGQVWAKRWIQPSNIELFLGVRS